MAHETEAVTRMGRVLKSRGVSPSLTHTFKLLTAQAVPCGIFGRTFATVKKTKTGPPSPVHSPAGPCLQRKRDLVRAPMADSASHPLLFPHDIGHQPGYAPPQRPSPCHSSVGGARNRKEVIRITRARRNRDTEEALCMLLTGR